MSLITIGGANLKTALGAIGRVVATKSSLPILNCCRLTAEGGELRIEGTDLELGASETVPAAGTARFSGAVHTRDLLTALKSLPKGWGTVDMEVERKNGGDWIAIRNGGGRVSLPTEPAEDMPELPQVSGQVVSATVRGGELAAVLAQVAPAMSTDETRPVLACLMLEFNPGAILAAATDTHRLHRSALPCSPDFGDGAMGVQVLIPAAMVGALLRRLPADSRWVTIAVDPGLIRVEWEDSRYISRLVDGQFPRYDRVIPAGPFPRVLTGELGPVAAAAVQFLKGRRCSDTNEDPFRAVIDTTAGTPRLVASGWSADLPMSVAGDRAPDTIMGFNPRYLADAAAAAGGACILSAHGPLSPALLTPADGGEFLAVLMPMELPKDYADQATVDNPPAPAPAPAEEPAPAPEPAPSPAPPPTPAPAPVTTSAPPAAAEPEIVKLTGAGHVCCTEDPGCILRTGHKQRTGVQCMTVGELQGIKGRPLFATELPRHGPRPTEEPAPAKRTPLPRNLPPRKPAKPAPAAVPAPEPAPAPAPPPTPAPAAVPTAPAAVPTAPAAVPTAPPPTPRRMITRHGPPTTLAALAGVKAAAGGPILLAPSAPSAPPPKESPPFGVRAVRP